MAVTKESEPNRAKEQDQTTGLSNRVVARNARTLRPDGTFNVKRRGLPWFRLYDIYQSLITMSWFKFFILVITAFLLINTFFATLYFEIGIRELTGYTGHSRFQEFLHGFFFSTQSLTTVGYGRIAPVGLADSAVAAVESMMGLLIFALATGLLYGKFSRPVAKIVNSKNVIISPYKNGTALMFKIANLRKNQLSEVEVSLTLSRIEIENGKEIRRFYPLRAEPSKIVMFPLSWTVVHPIDEKSELFGKTQNDFEREDMQMLVYLKAYDETFSNSVHHRIGYHYSDIVWGAKFRINFGPDESGVYLHHLDHMNDYDRVELPSVMSTST